MMQAKMKNKVLVIALDGGTFEVLRPLIEKNKLPTIKSILENGVNGQLRSILPPITPVAWSSFMTGKNPAKHRIFSFFVKDDHTGLEVPVDANLRKGKPFGILLGRMEEKSLS
jgi:predicted AlkP superfamily phosphohydrolase/phosphomutase